MKNILVFVSSLDGKITKWGDPRVRAWSSEEDQKYFSTVWNESKLIVMGSKTYSVEKILPVSTRLVVVMTSHPETYRKHEVEGELEFRNESPSGLTTHYETMGYETMIVVGGPHIATSFFKEGMLDEVWITIEPKVFGTGGNFVINEKLDADLELISFERINEQGTLILKYAVKK